MRFVLSLLCLYNLLFGFYFEVWDDNNLSYQKLPSSFNGYYNETLRPWSENELSSIALNADGLVFTQDAIMTSHTSLRAWPSDKPLFYNPSKVGEGYPFDYAQHSALYIGMPVKILQKSADAQWYFAITPANYGWIKADSVAFMDKNSTQTIKQMKLCTPLNDSVIMKNELSTPLKVGMALPCDDNATFVPMRQSNNYALFVKSSKLPQIPIDEDARRNMALGLLGLPYGWGGIYGDRDCSALMRDIFVGAGIFLKRNSKQQAAPDSAGYVDLSNYSANEKKNIIIQTAIPWRTLLYMPGHIVLYVGQKDGEPLVYQAIWGIKTFDFFGNEGRYIIGETIISTLDLNTSVKGYNLQKSSLAPKIKGMRTL